MIANRSEHQVVSIASVFIAKRNCITRKNSWREGSIEERVLYISHSNVHLQTRTRDRSMAFDIMVLLRGRGAWGVSNI